MVRIETSPLLPAGAWVALDRDRKAVAFGSASEALVIAPETMRTIVVAPDLMVNLEALETLKEERNL